MYYNHPEKPEGASKIYYLEEVVSCLKKTFSSSRTDSTFQAIDESMVKFKGRSSLKQHMPLKPIKRGIKIWERCDSATGYLYDFNIYQGKELQVESGTLGERVVKSLVSTLRTNEVVICIDRFLLFYFCQPDGGPTSGLRWHIHEQQEECAKFSRKIPWC